MHLKLRKTLAAVIVALAAAATTPAISQAMINQEKPAKPCGDYTHHLFPC
jgi:hypothetical protein